MLAEDAPARIATSTDCDRGIRASARTASSRTRGWSSATRTSRRAIGSESLGCQCATTLVAAARMREETRGCHWREDRPDRDDTAWRRHIVVSLNPDRTLAVHTTDTADLPPTRPQEQ